MTDDAPPVSRARYDRERRARAEAEAVLEQKSRELYEANQRLILETEAVRSALADTEALRQREMVALRENAILAKALTALSGKTSAAEAMQDLLQVLRAGFAIFDACYMQAHGSQAKIVTAADPGHAGLLLPIPSSLLDRPRRMAGLATLAGSVPLPADMGLVAATLVAPFTLPGEASGALVLICKTAGRFSPRDLKTLERVATLAAQALLALREARRNALLVSLVEGRPVKAAGGVLDAPLEAVHRAFSRLTDMQGQVVGIQDALLAASLDEVDQAIEASLGEMGRLTDTDRVYVFRLRPLGSIIDNSHEWCAGGVEPMRAMLQDIPVSMIDHWRATFEAGGDVLIPDVAALPDAAPEKAILLEQGIRSLLAVPMVQDGRFHGFVGYDAVRALRTFLPGEVHLIRAVAKVIAAVLARRDAEEQLVAAHAETTSQRIRLEAVLSAMPDLLVELDAAGRFVTWHSGAIVVPDAVGAAFAGRALDEVLPPDLAAEGRAVLAEIAAGARTVIREFPFALMGDWVRTWQLSASAIGDQGFLFVLRDVTEARAQIAEIQRLSEVARRTTNLVVVTDAERRIEWVNAAFEATTGWTLDEVRGRNSGQFLQSEATDPETVARLRKALNNGESVQAEILNRSRNGRDYWVALDIQPLRDASGKLQGYMAVEADVTASRQQAEALRQAADAAATARAILETAVEALQDGFVLYDAQDRLVICNSRYREIYAPSAGSIVPGATYEEILRAGMANGEYPDAIGNEQTWLADRIGRHRAPYSEFEQQLTGGTWLRVFEKATPDGGRVGLRVDITSLKQAEQRAVADRSTAMEASQDGIAITDAKGRFTYMNQSHMAMFGLQGEHEVLGQPWSRFYGPDEAAWIVANAMPKLQAEGRWSGEIMGRAIDGSPVDQDVSLTLKDDGGLLCITRDISARRHAAEERDRLQGELQLAQRREIIGQMAAGLAHDFNNLLATISGSAALIAEAVPQGTIAGQGAQRIVAASDQAAGLVRRLMTLGARPSAKEPLDMRRPVAEAAELIRASIRAPLTLSVSLPETPVEALVDPTDILQVVLNLAINARDAMAGTPGAIKLSLAPTTAADLAGPFAIGAIDPARNHVCLTVADTGPGIPAAVLAEVFRPYFTTKGEKGTGLGLAVVSSVVTANGGAVRLASAPGQGTRFDVLWPTGPAQHVEANLPLGMTGRLDGRTVLVVDDQPEVLAVLTAFLEAAGAEVAPSTDPADVVEALRDDPGAWDLLITDYDMPGMTGADLARTARDHAPGLPMILVTALAGLAGRSEALFDAVLAKPLDREALVRSAEAAILRRKLNG